MQREKPGRTVARAQERWCILLARTKCLNKFVEASGSQRSQLPLFPSKTGVIMKKAEVVHTDRVQQAGVQLVAEDGAGRPRQRFGGHVCRVVGAVWLFRTLGELYLVQLFCKVEIDSFSQVRAGFSTHGTSGRRVAGNRIFLCKATSKKRLQRGEAQGAHTEESLRSVVRSILPAITEKHEGLFFTIRTQTCPAGRKTIIRLPTVRSEHNQFESSPWVCSYHQLQGHEKSYSAWLGFSCEPPTSCSRVDKLLANHQVNAARSVGPWLTIHQEAAAPASSPRGRILLPVPVHHLLPTHQAGEVVSAVSSTQYSWK